MTAPWLPHDGGENPAPGKMVRVALRGERFEDVEKERPSKSEAWEWEHRRFLPEGDIIAYQVVE